MVKEHLLGQMENVIKEAGQLVNNTEMA